MKKFLFLFLFLYMFGVVLRVVGQLINNTPIDWKATLLLGEFDNTMNFDKRWYARVGTMAVLSFIGSRIKQR